ncbi:MAG: hypothetical protein D6767_04675 [Candidatus Hydrogenedentota bacterium]|nr:MAG: hypothetical protein D6767_04675 [Candidatus Hydrogenedentota bacterium]
MRTLKNFVCIVSFLFSFSIYSTSLNELITVWIEEPNLAGIEVTQKLYFVPNGELALLREQNLFLSLGESVELGIHIPWTNYIVSQVKSSSEVGDVAISLNFKTDWFKEFLLTNYYVEYNTGSGPEFDNLNNHPMLAYGYPEWRTGLIFFKKTKYFSWHFNLFYVFRGRSDDGGREFSLLEGFYLNPFDKETYKRGFGFAAKHPDAFFYYKKLLNDNMEYRLAINSELFYPFVPFLELTFSHDFRRGEFSNVYPRKGPGSGYFRSQISFGTKYFFPGEHFSLKAAAIFPLGAISNLYITGFSVGARVDF